MLYLPLLIYGADVPIEKVISISEFPNLVDDESWTEFMPPGVTKDLFRKFVEYYDADVFAEAGTQIRKLAKNADKLPPTKRVQVFEDYTSRNGILDFSRDINRQLYKLMGISKPEIEYIEETIRNLDASRNISPNQ